MLTLTGLGAIILTPVSGFYHIPQSVLDLVDHSVERESRARKPGVREPK
jgi:4-hydroxy-3-polyprenylbenzoate decarboxylase